MRHDLAHVPTKHEAGAPVMPTSPQVAQRLVRLRNQLRKVVSNFETVSDEVVRPENCPPTSNAVNPEPHDLIGVIGELEGIANELSDLADRLDKNIGSVLAGLKEEQAVRGGAR